MASSANRLVFTFSAGELTLEAAVEVAAVAPPTHDTAPEVLMAPFYCELQNDDGNVLYRRRSASPVSPTVEVPTGDPDRPFENRTVEDAVGGVFSILVPVLREGVFVELFATPDGLIGRSPSSMGRFDLRAAPRSWTPPFLFGDRR